MASRRRWRGVIYSAGVQLRELDLMEKIKRGHMTCLGHSYAVDDSILSSLFIRHIVPLRWSGST